MTFSLRTLLFVLLISAFFFLIAAPYFRTQRAEPTYEMENAGGLSAWEYASLHSPYVFRGSDIPTLIVSRSHSKSVPYLQAGNLPFAIYILADDDDKIQIQHVTNIDDACDATATIEIRRDKQIIVAEYQLNCDRGSKPYKITERFYLGNLEYELSSGRLFEIDLRGPTPCHSQIELKEIHRGILPKKFGNSSEAMQPILMWWDSVKPKHQIAR